MDIQELLTEWRQTYIEWISTELQLRTVRQQRNSGALVPMLEERIQRLKSRCTECQDAASTALATLDEPDNAT
jgi:hypothetical protein